MMLLALELKVLPVLYLLIGLSLCSVLVLKTRDEFGTNDTSTEKASNTGKKSEPISMASSVSPTFVKAMMKRPLTSRDILLTLVVVSKRQTTPIAIVIDTMVTNNTFIQPPTFNRTRLKLN